MKKNEKRKGMWIPIELMECSELDWANKILLAEIHSLHKHPKGCFASNEFFAALLGLENASGASRRITRLKELGYITTENKFDKNNCLGRIITPTFKKGSSFEDSMVAPKSKRGSSTRNQKVVPEHQEGSSEMSIGVVPERQVGSSQTTRGVVPERLGGSSNGNTINTITNTDILKQENSTVKLIHTINTDTEPEENRSSILFSQLEELEEINPELTLEEYEVLMNRIFIEEKNWRRSLRECGIQVFLKITKYCHHNEEANISIVKCYFKLILEKQLNPMVEKRLVS